MKWVLDCGPLGHLAPFARLEWAWPPSTLHITKQVETEALETYDHGATRNKELLDPETEGRPWIEVHDIPISSAAAEMFASHLRPNNANASRNVGEDESIAFCAEVEPDGVFVTADRNAAFVALAELGCGRVATPFDLWEHLKNANLISNEDFDKLCLRVSKQLKNILPGMPWRFR